LCWASCARRTLWVVRVGGVDGELRPWHYMYVYSIEGRSKGTPQTWDSTLCWASCARRARSVARLLSCPRSNRLRDPTPNRLRSSVVTTGYDSAHKPSSLRPPPSTLHSPPSTGSRVEGVRSRNVYGLGNNSLHSCTSSNRLPLRNKQVTILLPGDTVAGREAIDT